MKKALFKTSHDRTTYRGEKNEENPILSQEALDAARYLAPSIRPMAHDIDCPYCKLINFKP